MRDRIKRVWRRLSPSWRLAVGFGLIFLVELGGLTPMRIAGVDAPWPYAALWAAAGWGASGLSFRPMLALAAFGVLQDLLGLAPIGVFMLVNLVAYAASAAFADTVDVDGDPTARLVAPAVSIAAGVTALWVLASGVENHPVSPAPLAMAFIVTMIGYLFAAPVFRLGVRSGANFSGARP